MMELGSLAPALIFSTRPTTVTSHESDMTPPSTEPAIRSHHDRLRLHLFDDGDHRLVDRLELLWELTVAHLGELGVV